MPAQTYKLKLVPQIDGMQGLTYGKYGEIAALALVVAHCL